MTLTKLSSNPDKNLAPGSTMATTTMMGATNKDDPQQKEGKATRREEDLTSIEAKSC